MSKPTCANWMNFGAVRKAVEKHEEQWAPRDPKDRIPYNLSDLNLTRQCIICDFGGSGRPELDQLARVFESSTVNLQDTVRKLTGEPMKRICYKETE